jgi:Leucine-rich repeat (LRR) protein
MLQILGSALFTDCTKLRSLYLSGNNVSEISTSSFRGLEQLEQLDLSNNNIEELNSSLFESFSINTNRHSHQVSKLKHLNLAQNKIRSFNFELHFPSKTNSETSDLTYELVSLNVSSNRLDSLDAASVMWLKHTAAVTDLSGNPWKCECSALGEAWRELRDKLTLNCASPEDRMGRKWDVLVTFCPDISLVPTDNDKPNVSSDASPNISTSPEDRKESTLDVTTTLCPDRIICPVPTDNDKLNPSSDATPNIPTDTGPAITTSSIIVIGVLAACVLCCG